MVIPTRLTIVKVHTTRLTIVRLHTTMLCINVYKGNKRTKSPLLKVEFETQKL